MASKSSQKKEIDRQIPEKNILYTSPPEARSLNKWVREVETKHASKTREVETKRATDSKTQAPSKTQRAGKSKRAAAKANGPWRLVYSEEYSTKKEALLRERFFKTGTGRKLRDDAIARQTDPG